MLIVVDAFSRSITVAQTRYVPSRAITVDVDATITDCVELSIDSKTLNKETRHNELLTIIERVLICGVDKTRTFKLDNRNQLIDCNRWSILTCSIDRWRIYLNKEITFSHKSKMITYNKLMILL